MKKLALRLRLNNPKLESIKLESTQNVAQMHCLCLGLYLALY
ncbi:hypothetical protein HFN_1861 [Helicobacter fennelliae MRY12-0050]|uniref:Uncharacterized protein n=1 Tax=Helicobacter fennelliae MRY12-0050 TaxID=1325130 RepID=T1DUW6_9HELI|nr:hypothetical protein HFN_1861 [Helicobacter fennelliae MRY12-0050]